MIISKNAKDSTSNSIKNTDSSWCELFRESCKINAFDSPDSSFIRSKEFSDSIHNTFDHKWRTKEHNEAGWLLLSSVDKVMKKIIISEILTPSFRSRYSASNLLRLAWVRFLSPVEKELKPGKQTQALMQVADLQQKVHAEPRQMSAVKVRALIGKQWDSETWNGDVWEDPDAARDTKSVNSDEHSLPEETASPSLLGGSSNIPPNHAAISLSTLSEEINLVLPEATVMASPEAAARQDNVDSPQEPLPTLLFASRPITRLKSQWAPRSEGESVTHEEVCYSQRELLEFSNLYKQKLGEHILRVWENGGRNIEMDQDEFIDLDPPSRDSAFNVAAQGIRKGRLVKMTSGSRTLGCITMMWRTY
uniref:Uncharacterized protein n=1 Tax=Callithrix jacchus TaxID=9483 RepID=A0A8I3W3S7_CALJA